jgi:hypothetical protein
MPPQQISDMELFYAIAKWKYRNTFKKEKKVKENTTRQSENRQPSDV